MRIKSTALIFLVIGASALRAQNPPCVDIGDEPNHQLVLENGNVRIFQLDLPRLKTTDVFCVGHPYIRIVVTEGRTSDLALGGPVSVAHDWKAGEGRFIYYEPIHLVQRIEMLDRDKFLPPVIAGLAVLGPGISRRY